MPKGPGSYRLNGLYPLAYMGVNPPSPTNLTIQSQAPTTTDSQNFQLGDVWLVPTTTPAQYWVLVNLSQGVATWVQLYPGGGGGGGANAFPTDNGTANEVGGVLNILGDGQNINTVGSGDTVTVNLDSHIVVDLITDTSLGLGVVQSDAGGTLSSSNGTTGQVLIGGTGTAPQWSTLTAGTNIAINSTVPHQITISASGLNPAASCALFYYQATTAVGVIGGSNPNPYKMGSAVELTEIYDNSGGAFSPGDGVGAPATFTAPATGFYNIQMTFASFSSVFNGIQSTAFVTVTGTSANVYYEAASSLANSDNARGNFFIGNFSSPIHMTLGDIATWSVWQREIGSIPTPDDILGNGQMFLSTPSGLRTWISVFRIV